MGINGQEHRSLQLGAPEAVAVTASYVAGSGWQLAIGVRRQFQSWASASRGRYSYLTTEEMFEVIEAELTTELQL